MSGTDWAPNPPWDDPIADVIIPAFNEEDSIGHVLREIPADRVREVIVVDNGSTDETGKRASEGGARVLREERRGYGSACLKGLAYLKEKQNKPHIVVFLDADRSDRPEEMGALLTPIIHDEKDLVIGSRALGEKEKGAMLPQQIFGNWLATRLLKVLYNVRFTDLGPFRAIRYDKLLALGMADRDYGWTVEMQIKAAKNGLACAEVPVSYRKRIGRSKIAGTVKGTVMAGYKILKTLFTYR